MKRILAVVAMVSMMGIAHADPEIDGTDQQQFDESIRSIREALDESEVSRFNQAISVLTMRRLSEGLSMRELSELSDEELQRRADRARSSLDGLSGEEVIRLAREEMAATYGLE
ncbi:DUF6694 family lipoprotein [Vreelandella sp. EE27]